MFPASELPLCSLQRLTCVHTTRQQPNRGAIHTEMHEEFVDSIGRHGLDKGLHFEQSLTRRADLGCRLNDSEVKGPGFQIGVEETHLP